MNQIRALKIKTLILPRNILDQTKLFFGSRNLRMFNKKPSGEGIKLSACISS